MKNPMRHVRKPFKGLVAYEWQAGPLVFQWVYGKSAFIKARPLVFTANHLDGSRRVCVGNARVWTDPYWR